VLLFVVTAAALAGWQRTELVFGTGIPGGGVVAASDWQAFVDEAVLPAFPDGFTVVDAEGVWNGGREDSRILLIVHERNRAVDAAIEGLRAAYVERFHQESVLRIDTRAKVSF
jgi:hypothetical protein